MPLNAFLNFGWFPQAIQPVIPSFGELFQLRLIKRFRWSSSYALRVVITVWEGMVFLWKLLHELLLLCLPQIQLFFGLLTILDSNVYHRLLLSLYILLNSLGFKKPSFFIKLKYFHSVFQQPLSSFNTSLLQRIKLL